VRKYQRPGLRRLLTQDIGIKLAALLLALFLWFNVAEKRPVEGVTELPLEYANLPANLAFAAKPPAAAKVLVRGSGRFMRWKLKDVRLVINLSLATRGMNTHLVSPAEVAMPADRGIQVLEVIDPKAVRVDLDVVASREVAVAPALRGDLAPDKILMGSATADPPRVTITGAQRVISALASVPTAPIDINTLARRGRVTSRVDLAAFPSLTSAVEDVTVAATIEARKELGIPAVPVTAEGSDRVTASFLPGSVDLVVSGAASQMDSLDPREVALVIEIAGLVRGQAQLRAVVEDGRLSFDALPADAGAPAGGRGAQARRLRSRLTSPYRLDVVSVAPEEIALALR
jgi:YbbR domain-containing protein